MSTAIIGSESVTAGVVTPYALRTRYVLIHPGVYVPRNTTVDALTRAEAAWLWSRRRGVVAGLSAAVLHGSKWVDPGSPAELFYGNRHRPAGIRTYADRLAEDEVVEINRMRVTTPARTALDLACRNPINRAVAAIDALANATDLKVTDVELLCKRYRGRRGVTRVPAVLNLVDAGAESPRETWLRLLLLRAGFPRPRTQIPVYDEFNQLIARLDMGWEDAMIAAEYDGDHHRTDRRQFNRDIARTEALTAMGWNLVRITSEDTPAGITHRVEAAFARQV